MLNTKQLSYGVRERQILSGVNFHASRGEFIGIVGPNGSGKSTFLKNVYKVLKPQSGQIELMNEDLLAMSNREMAQRMAVVVQERENSFDFSVEEVVMMGRQARRRLLEREDDTDRALVERVLREMQLIELKERDFASLSGGEKQRVLIARALAQETEVLVLDEPTNHLDIQYQFQLMETIQRLNCTVIAALHDLNLAAMYCDRIYALKEGHVVGVGTPRELLTADFIREIYEVDAQVSPAPDGTLRIFFRRGCGN